MTRRTTPALLLLAVSAITLTACTGGDASTPASTLSPIDVYLSAGQGTAMSEEAQQAEGDAWLLANEELIAECMNEQGFEYLPHAPTPLGFSFNRIGTPELDDPEWIERYGYGIVFEPGREEVTISPDPNEEIVAGLTPAERTAYYTALVGEQVPFDPDSEQAPPAGGCMSEAQAELDGDDPLKGDEFAPLLAAIDDFYGALDLEPEIVALNEAWAECMSIAGLGPYVSQMDPIGEFNWAFLDLVQELGEEAWNDPQLQELGAREVEVAQADHACREETDYRASYAAVRTALEERFVEDNRADLESFKAAAEQAGSGS